MSLNLSHGQAYVERGFSINKQVLDGRTTLSERVLCATRTAREVINRYDSIMNIPITPSLLFVYRSSHRKYKEARENEKAETANQSVLGKGKLPLENDRDYMTQTRDVVSVLTSQSQDGLETQFQTSRSLENVGRPRSRSRLGLKIKRLGLVSVSHHKVSFINRPIYIFIMFALTVKRVQFYIRFI